MQTWSGQAGNDGDSSDGAASGNATGLEGQDPELGGGSASGNGGSTSAQSSAQSEATTWMPVETCVPCQQDSNAAPSPGSTSSSSSSFSNPAGRTEQVGVTQVSPAGGAAGILTSAEGGTTTSAVFSASPTGKVPIQAHEDDELSRRQAEEGEEEGEGGDDTETVTKNGQCCHTTWTPSVLSEAGPTGTEAAGGAASSPTGGVSTASASRNSGGSRGSLGGVTPSGTLHVGGAGPSGSVNASGRVAGSLGPGSNSTNVTGGNGTGNGSGAGLRMDIVGLEGSWGVAFASGVAIGVAAVGGGWSLI
jgi:hypothetical protein